MILPIWRSARALQFEERNLACGWEADSPPDRPTKSSCAFNEDVAAAIQMRPPLMQCTATTVGIYLAGLSTLRTQVAACVGPVVQTPVPEARISYRSARVDGSGGCPLASLEASVWNMRADPRSKASEQPAR